MAVPTAAQLTAQGYEKSVENGKTIYRKKGEYTNVTWQEGAARRTKPISFTTAEVIFENGKVSVIDYDTRLSYRTSHGEETYSPFVSERIVYADGQMTAHTQWESRGVGRSLRSTDLFAQERIPLDRPGAKRYVDGEVVETATAKDLTYSGKEARALAEKEGISVGEAIQRVRAPSPATMVVSGVKEKPSHYIVEYKGKKYPTPTKDYLPLAYRRDVALQEAMYTSITGKQIQAAETKRDLFMLGIPKETPKAQADVMASAAAYYKGEPYQMYGQTFKTEFKEVKAEAAPLTKFGMIERKLSVFVKKVLPDYTKTIEEERKGVTPFAVSKKAKEIYEKVTFKPETTIGIKRGAYEYVKEKPIHAGIDIALMAAFPPTLEYGGLKVAKWAIKYPRLAKAARVAKAPTKLVPKSVRKWALPTALTTAYVGTEAYGIATAPIPSERAGEAIARAGALTVGYGIGIKLRTRMVEKLVKARGYQVAKAEMVRVETKGVMLEEAGVEARVKVSKEFEGVEIQPREFDVGVSAKKFIETYKKEYYTETLAIVKGKKRLDIFKGVGMGEIEAAQYAKAVEKMTVSGFEVPSKITRAYKVVGEEKSVLDLVSRYTLKKGIIPTKLKPIKAFGKVQYAGEFAETHYPLYEFKEFGVSPKFLGIKGEAYTDYILGTRQTLKGIKGATAEARATAQYKIFAGKKEKFELGVGELKGVTYPGIVPKEEMVEVYYPTGKKWTFEQFAKYGIREGFALEKVKRLSLPKAVEKMFKTKKAELAITLPKPEVTPTPKQIPGIKYPKPAVTAMQEAEQAARASYLKGISGLKFVPITKPTIKTAMKPIMKPIMKPALKPVIKTAIKPALKPAVKPALKPTLKPAVKPAIKTAVKPMLKTALKPALKPAMKPSLKPITKPLIPIPERPPPPPSLFKLPEIKFARPEEPKKKIKDIRKRKYVYTPSLISLEAGIIAPVKEPLRRFAPTSVRPIPKRFEKKYKKLVAIGR